MKKKRGFVTVISVILITAVVSSLVPAAVFAVAEGTSAETSVLESIHKKIDISAITGEGGNPQEISGEASATAAEKQWYEYLQYSSEPAGIYNYNSNVRLLFYDPYDYSGALLMKVDEELTDWTSANSINCSYTTGNSLITGYSSSSSTDTSVVSAQGADVNMSYSTGTSTSNTNNWSAGWNTSSSLSTEAGLSSEIGTEVQTGVSGTVGVETGASVSKKIGGFDATVSGSASASTTVSASASLSAKISTNLSTTVGASSGSSGSAGGSAGSGTSTSSSSGWTIVADRLTKSMGTEFSNSKSISTSDSTTVSTTYSATYFNESGSPLQWKIVRYAIYMPMYVEVQYKCDDEWYTVESSYAMLTTIQGTCRAYMENGVAYYEHWGTGEPVTWDEFWSGFFTEDSLLAAYQNKLYPTK